MNYDIAPYCRLCGEILETFHHILTDCPRLRIAREQAWSEEEGDPEESQDWTVKDMIEFIKTRPIPDMLIYKENYNYVTEANDSP